MNNEKLTISRLDDDDFLVHYACDLRSQMDKMQFVKTDNSGKPSRLVVVLNQYEHRSVAVVDRLKLFECRVLGGLHFAQVLGLADADIARVIIP